MQYLFLASLLVVGCVGYSLPRDQNAFRPDAQGKTVAKRSSGNYPWFLPAVFVPQVIEVHHVVYLQQPDSRCFPNVPNIPRPTPGPGGNSTERPILDDRFGGTNDSASEPSRCVWAIVACCAPGSKNIKYTCFELLGCQGAFWDVNPCEASIVSAAANTALKFYMSNSNSTQSNDIPVELNN